MGFDGDGEGDGVIHGAGALVAHAEGESSGEAPEVAVDGVILLFHCAVAGFEMMADACAPVFVHAIIEAAEENVIVGFRAEGGIAGEIAVAETGAPDVAGCEGDGVAGEI